jgi:hypothetical protein
MIFSYFTPRFAYSPSMRNDNMKGKGLGQAITEYLTDATTINTRMVKAFVLFSV